MFKVLVADDEKIIRKGIIAILKREFQEELECFEASNGLEALEVVDKESPNLVITDISMPQANGLEVIKQLKEKKNPAKVIILSGYENFDYAKSAMKLGVTDYIMKPIKKQEFLDLVREYIHSIKENWEQTREETIKYNQNRKMLEQVKHETFVKLLSAKSSKDTKKEVEKLKSFGYPLHAPFFLCAVLEYEVKEGNKDYIDFVVKNILDECFEGVKEDAITHTIAYEAGEIAIVFEGNEGNSFLESQIKRLEEAQRLIGHYGKIEVTVGVGDTVYDSSYLHKSFQHGFIAANTKIYKMRESNIYYYTHIPRGVEEESLSFDKILKVEKQGMVIEVLNQFDTLMKKDPSIHRIRALQKSYEELEEILQQKVYWREEDVKTRIMKPFHQLWGSHSLKLEVKKAVEELKNKSLEEEEGFNKILTSEILYYVKNHLTEDLDLNMVADYFQKTPGYISLLFKKATEDGFNSYITKERMKIATKLLEETNLSIASIAEACGYGNAKYFSVVFKKVTGKSPKEYRERALRLD